MDAQDLYLAHREHGIQAAASDLALLEAITGPTPPTKKRFQRRDEDLDPLLLAAAASSGPHATRNHYQHDFFPAVSFPRAEGAFDWTKWQGEQKQGKRLAYVSRQAPRSVRLRREKTVEDKENVVQDVVAVEPLQPAENIVNGGQRRPSISTGSISQSPAVLTTPISPPPAVAVEDVQVKCMARTRIPTPHGPVFLHLYHNTRDAKEHLALVVDPAQFSDAPPVAPPIRSRSLDAVWNDNETEMDRIIRGAYTGRLSPSTRAVAPPHPSADQAQAPSSSSSSIPPPLVRLHSECFTGETVGSMRCDCGEQLDEALRQMSRTSTVLPDGTRVPGRGVVVYLRQEGRGIGLLSKIRAYNLQDLGHDTVAANLLLGHGADERRYDVAVAIMRDLGLGGDGAEGGVRLLTNNPDKVQALEKEGLRVVERVPMVPRSWQKKQRHAHPHPEPHIADPDEEVALEDDGLERKAGATMVGGEAVYGEDLDKYLRTKVLRMGHMLSLQQYS